jgi:PD-(D/E)XK nuclease superfamily protein
MAGLRVELKAFDRLSGIHEAQLMSYLKSTGIKIGLLINFNVKLLKDGGNQKNPQMIHFYLCFLFVFSVSSWLIYLRIR